MIARAGVTVEPPQAAAVARILADHVRANGPDRELELLIGELERMSTRADIRGQSLAGERRWLSTAAMAGREGVTDRAIRHRIAVGRYPGAKRERNEWRIPIGH